MTDLDVVIQLYNKRETLTIKKLALAWNLAQQAIESSNAHACVFCLIDYIQHKSFEYSMKGESLLANQDALNAHNAFSKALNLNPQSNIARIGLMKSKRILSSEGYLRLSKRFEDNHKYQLSINVLRKGLSHDTKNERLIDAFLNLSLKLGYAALNEQRYVDAHKLFVNALAYCDEVNIIVFSRLQASTLVLIAKQTESMRLLDLANVAIKVKNPVQAMLFALMSLSNHSNPEANRLVHEFSAILDSDILSACHFQNEMYVEMSGVSVNYN